MIFPLKHDGIVYSDNLGKRKKTAPPGRNAVFRLRNGAQRVCVKLAFNAAFESVPIQTSNVLASLTQPRVAALQ